MQAGCTPPVSRAVQVFALPADISGTPAPGGDRGLVSVVEVRNEARVHLWYATRFGATCPPFSSVEDAISSFPSTITAIGARLEIDGQLRIYAPFGGQDVLDLVVRPNPRLAKKEVYEEKTKHWKDQWPELTILPWPQ